MNNTDKTSGENTDKNKIRRYLNGTYMMSEADELYDSLCCASEEGEALDEVAAEVWEEAAGASQPTPFAERTAYKEAQSLLKGLNGLNRKHTFPFKRWAYAAVGIAASLMFIFLGSYWMNYSDINASQLAEVTTSFGEKKQVVLADGSRIVLNACSSLQYPKEFKGDVRKVHLAGQAFFEVARNEEMPFFVETGDFEVQVLGTEFDVKSYAGDEMASVEVKSGKVQVTLPEATLRLKKEEQILMNTVSGDFNKKKGNKEVASWRTGSLSFNHTPIRDVARELERIYHCKIIFKEGQEFVNLITGEHDNQSLESILESLRFVSGMNYSMQDDGSILIYK